MIWNAQAYIGTLISDIDRLMIQDREGMRQGRNIVCVYTCMFVYIYIYRERERDTHTYTHIRIYMYMHMYTQLIHYDMIRYDMM